MPPITAASLRPGRGAAAIVAVTLVVSLVGLMIGTELWIPLGAILGIGLACITNIAFHFHPPTTRHYFTLAIAVTLFAPMIQQATGIPVGYVAEALFVCLMLPLTRALAMTARRDSWLLAALLALGGFLAIAVASSLIGHPRRMAAAWQFFYDLKWVFMLAIGLMTTWDDKSIDTMRKLIRWGWIFLLLFVVFETTAPGIYNELMNAAPHRDPNPFLGWLPGRMKGPFPHAGYLANFSGLLAAASLIFSRLDGWKPYALPFAMYVILMLIAGERQEFADWAVLTCVLLWLDYKAARFALPAFAVLGAAALVFLSAYTSFELSAKLAAEWDFSGLGNDLSERGILTLYAAKIANMNFPFGSGLGTYGGAGAQKFDQSLFVELGFLRYWWFRQGLFLVDTYWPNLIAEGGWIGATFALASNIVIGLRLWLLALRDTDKNRQLYLLAFSAFVLMFMNTMTSGMISDPRGVFVFWIVIGIAIREALSAPAATSVLPPPPSSRPNMLWRPS